MTRQSVSINATIRFICSGRVQRPKMVYICPTNFINYTFVEQNKINMTWATHFSNINSSPIGDLSRKDSFLKLKQSLWERLSIRPLIIEPEIDGTPTILRRKLETYKNFSGHSDRDGKWVDYYPGLYFNETGLERENGYWDPWPSTTPASTSTSTTTTTASPLTFHSLQEYFLSIGYAQDHFVRECSFEGTNIECASIIEEYFDKDHGKCFLLTVEEKQIKAGEGLSLVLDINSDLYPPAHAPVNDILFDGAYLMIRRRFHPAIVDKILISPSEYTKVGLDARRIRRTSGNHGGKKRHCRSEVEGFHVLQLDEYSVEACHMDCTQEIIVRRCACLLAVDTRFIRPSILALLSNRSSTNRDAPRDGFCTVTFHPTEYKNHFQASDMSSCVHEVLEANKTEVQRCMLGCHPVCEEWSYVPTLSHLKFPSAAMLILESEKKKMTKDAIILDISFLQLQYTDVVQRHSMSMATFISNIGGQMGVWMGASILTVIQLMLVAISYFLPKKNKSGL